MTEQTIVTIVTTGSDTPKRGYYLNTGRLCLFCGETIPAAVKHFESLISKLS